MEGSGDAAATGAEGASSAECDQREETDTKRVDGRGGRREDAFGNTLGGRPKKINKIEAPPGQLGVFAYLNRPKPPTQNSNVTAEGATPSTEETGDPRSVLETAAPSVGTHGITRASETQEHHVEHHGQTLSTFRSEVSTILQEEISRSLGTFTSTLKTTQEEIVASIEKAGEKVSCEMNEKQRLLVAHTQLHVLSNKYAAVLSTGNVFCVICTENAGAMIDGRSQKSRFIASNGGVNQDNRLSQRWREHEGSDIHACCIEISLQREMSPMSRAISDVQLRERAVMETLLSTCAFTNIHKQSFTMYEHNVVHLAREGVDIGASEHSRLTAREMTLSLAEFGRQQFRSFLTSDNPMTGRKPHFGLAADKLTDLGKIQSQIVMGRVNYAGSALTLFVKLQPLGIEYDEDHEASGLACFNQLCEVTLAWNYSGLFLSTWCKYYLLIMCSKCFTPCR